MDTLQTPIEYLKGIGPNRANLLKQELNIFTFQDLLHFFPNRYIDRSTFYKIKDLPKNTSEVQIKGKIIDFKMIPQKEENALWLPLPMGKTIWSWSGFAVINGSKRV